MNSQASNAMLNGFTSQLTNSVTTSPLGLRAMPPMRAEIHLEHHRIDHQPEQHADGHVDLRALAEFQLAQLRR